MALAISVQSERGTANYAFASGNVTQVVVLSIPWTARM
jgi:hypothetical protein